MAPPQNESLFGTGEDSEVIFTPQKTTALVATNANSGSLRDATQYIFPGGQVGRALGRSLVQAATNSLLVDLELVEIVEHFAEVLLVALVPGTTSNHV